MGYGNGGLAERAQSKDSEAERRSAVHRVLDYYLHAAVSASNFISPYFT
jgi:hypothetical protein